MAFRPARKAIHSGLRSIQEIASPLRQSPNMAIHHDPALEHSLGAIAVPSMRIGHRLISLGDEHALMREEAKPLAASVLKVRRASGAARIVAGELLATIGCGGIAIPKHASGAPIWPQGIAGSLAHDNRIAIAALALGCDFCALGIDIEPAETLPAEVTDLVATPRERQMIQALSRSPVVRCQRGRLQGPIPSRPYISRSSRYRD
jgi:4'-phosphopantetheinyl transferase EntD